MTRFHLPGLLFGAAASLAFSAATFAQPFISIESSFNLIPDYQAPDLEDDSPGSLTVYTDSAGPAQLNFNGLAGTLDLEFSAPVGYQFNIMPADGSATLSFQVAYTTGSSHPDSDHGVRFTGTPTITFIGLVGTAPALSNYSNMGHYGSGSGRYPYLAISFDAGGWTDGFSFTGFRFSQLITGTGANVTVPYFEGGQLSVSNQDYNGLPPPNHASLMSITATASAVPEPSTYAAICGAAVGAFAVLRRRRAQR